MTTYLIKGINPSGETEQSETTIGTALLFTYIEDTARSMFKNWDKFTIEVEALDDEPDHAR